jgi:predicted dehydrogenase
MTLTKPLRIGYLSVAHIHAQDWIQSIVQATDGRTVHAVWDDDVQRGKRHADMAKSRFEPELATLIADPQVDAFIISAENVKHLAILRQAIPAKKPILCEKPIALTAAEATEIRQLIEKHGTTLVNGYVYPFEGRVQAAMRVIANGTLGTITHATFRNTHGGAWFRWFDDPALAWFRDLSLSGGGGLLDEGTHGIHCLRTLFGKVTKVWATTRNLSKQYPSADDFGIVHLQFANGMFGTVEGSWIQVAGVTKGLEVCGSKGVLFKTVRDGYVVQRPDGSMEPQTTPEPVVPRPTLPHYVDRLVAACRGELEAADLKRDFDAALDSVVIMDAARCSAKSGNWISLGAACATAR